MRRSHRSPSRRRPHTRQPPRRHRERHLARLGSCASSASSASCSSASSAASWPRPPSSSGPCRLRRCRERRGRPRGRVRRRSAREQGDGVSRWVDARVVRRVDADLREATLAPEAQLSVTALFGGVSLRVPADWRIESSVRSVAGGFDASGCLRTIRTRRCCASTARRSLVASPSAGSRCPSQPKRPTPSLGDVVSLRHLRCFNYRPLAGNQLAVFTDARAIPEDVLQPLARRDGVLRSRVCLPRLKEPGTRSSASSRPRPSCGSPDTRFSARRSCLAGPTSPEEIRLETVGSGRDSRPARARGREDRVRAHAHPVPTVEPSPVDDAVLSTRSGSRSRWCRSNSMTTACEPVRRGGRRTGSACRCHRVRSAPATP